MDLAVLNSSFKRDRLVENWNSLIWTERHSKNGDFQLASYRISDVLNLLPIGNPLDPPTVVSIEDSSVPMIVETHKIEKDKHGIPKIITSGRSFETVLDRRQAIYTTPFADPTSAETAGVKRIDKTVQANNAAVAAYAVMNDIIVTGLLDANDIIPEVTILNSVGSAGTLTDFNVDPKDLYSWVTETLALAKYGLKAQLSAASTVALIIYAGTDRSSGENSVTFDVALDQFDQASYLLSQVGHKNVMITSAQNRLEITRLLPTEPSGLARRVGYLNLESEITLSNEYVGLTNALINRGKVSLADLVPTALFSGGVSRDIGLGYNSTYFLGDIVRLQGEYGLSQNARVAEFVRTHDTTGEKAYPTFEAVT